MGVYGGEGGVSWNGPVWQHASWRVVGSHSQRGFQCAEGWEGREGQAAGDAATPLAGLEPGQGRNNQRTHASHPTHPAAIADGMVHHEARETQRDEIDAIRRRATQNQVRLAIATATIGPTPSQGARRQLSQRGLKDIT